MKKTKLTLEKFRVSRLTNLSIIKGGGGRTDGTILVTNDRPRCNNFSDNPVKAN